MKKCSGLNQERNLYRCPNSPEELWTNMWLDFNVKDNRRWSFSLEEALLWIMDSYFSWKQRFEVKNALMMGLFQLLSSQDVNWCTGVVWIIVMFLSAVWTLILTAPIHCWGSIGEQVMQCCISPNLMKKQTHLHLVWQKSANLNFWVTHRH